MDAFPTPEQQENLILSSRNLQFKGKKRAAQAFHGNEVAQPLEGLRISGKGKLVATYEPFFLLDQREELLGILGVEGPKVCSNGMEVAGECGLWGALCFSHGFTIRVHVDLKSTVMPHKVAGELSISDLSEHTGVSKSALRYYETQGLLHSYRRTSGHRRYEPSAVQEVRFILLAQHAGFSISAIQTLMHPPEGEPVWNRLAEQKLKDLDQQITKLEQMKEILREGMGCGCLDLAACTLLDPA